jgi:glycosyltransferase involved in cell wall biosynthesis
MLADKPLLSICIPTYNRPDKIESAIKSLMELEDINLAEIFILDNCSGIKVEAIYENIDSKLSNIKIIRNSINIGGSVNLLRCIEYAQTDWIWLLGDDDIALKSSVKTILDDITTEISLGKNAAMIKYSSELGYVKDSIYIDDYAFFFYFLTKNNFFSNFLFMSSTIINRRLFNKYYIEAFDCTSFSHIYPAFPLLYHKEAGVLISEKRICKWRVPEPRYHWFYGTAYYKMLHQFSAIPFVSKRDVRIISRKWLHIKIKDILMIGIIMTTHNIDKNITIKTFKNYYHYTFSSVQRFFLGPIYLFSIASFSNKLLFNWVIKYYKNYKIVKEMVVNF